MPLISIIIVSFNTRELLRECLQAVYAQVQDTAFEVIIVDNASHDGSPAMVRECFPEVQLLALDDNRGFGGGNNAGVAAARGEFVFLLNSDAILLHNTPRALVDYLQTHADVACVGPRIVLPSLALQPQAFGHLPSPWRLLMQAIGGGRLGMRLFEGVDGELRAGREQVVGWLSGVCFCLRRAHYVQVGGFDERFFMYAEDVALCGRLLPLGRSVLLDDFEVLHYGGASSPSAASRIRNAVWQQRHILLVCRDQYGRAAAVLGSLIVGAGLLLRLGAALLQAPRRGLAGNTLLQTSIARLLDLCGRRRIPARPVIQLNGNPHAHRH